MFTEFKLKCWTKKRFVTLKSLEFIAENIKKIFKENG